MEVLIKLTIPVLLLLTALIVGSFLERRHYRSIREREAMFRQILVFTERQPSPIFSGQPFYLVCGSVVISGDCFKAFAAGLKGLIGGRLTSYETLLDRARREAILRMQEEAAQYGAAAIFNVRLETSTLNQNKNIICAEVIAYGTAFKAPPVQNQENIQMW